MVSYIMISDSKEENPMYGISEEESHFSGLKREEETDMEPEEEEEPEEHQESEPAVVPDVTPLPPVPSRHSGQRSTRITCTARMSVIQPRQKEIVTQETEKPFLFENGAYFTPAELNPGYQPTPPNPVEYEEYNNPKWDKIHKYLRGWRRNLHFPVPSEVSESSNAHQLYPFTHKPPHHTTPLLAAVAHEHERRLDRIDINLMEMPGYQELEQVGNHMYTLEAKTTDLNNQVFAMSHQLGFYQQATNNLMDREIEYSNHLMATSEYLSRTANEVEALRNRRLAEDRRMVEVERRLGEMEQKMHQFNTQVNNLEAYMHVWDIVPNDAWDIGASMMRQDLQFNDLP